MKRIIISGILFLSVISLARSQDLLIRYDFVNKNIYYFKIKKHDGKQVLIPLRSPKIGANKTVKIEYININPFIWDQPRLNLVAVAQDSVSSFNPFTMLIPTSISDKLGPLSLGLTRDAGPPTKQQQVCLAALDSLYDAYDKIDALKFNYKLTKQQILDQSKSKLRNVLKTCTSTEKTDTSSKDIKKTDFEKLRNYFKDICQVNISDNTRSADNSKMNSFLGTTGINSNTKELMPIDALNKIEKDYFTLSDADFVFENSFLVNDRDVVLHMGFNLTDEYKKKAAKDSASAARTIKHPQTVKDESIFIPIRGGVRVSTSAGIGCTYLGAARRTYYLENDTLHSAPDNRIVPIVGSILNVYSRRLGVVNIGGSFGLGVALQETFSIHYMLGLTTVFGRKEKVLFTVGAVLSPVSEPANRDQINTYYPYGAFPTKTIYKVGIFFFVHYNIGKF